MTISLTLWRRSHTVLVRERHALSLFPSFLNDVHHRCPPPAHSKGMFYDLMRVSKPNTPFPVFSLPTTHALITSLYLTGRRSAEHAVCRREVSTDTGTALCHRPQRSPHRVEHTLCFVGHCRRRILYGDKRLGLAAMGGAARRCPQYIPTSSHYSMSRRLSPTTPPPHHRAVWSIPWTSSRPYRSL